MSREFSTSEIIRQKCYTCGSKNKLYTEFVYSGIHYGYMLTCCNCGHVDIFMKEGVDPSGILGAIYHKGRECCIQLTTCHNKDCKYYGKSSLWNAKTTIDDALNGTNTSKSDNDKKNNCECEENCNCNKNPITVELDINKSDCRSKFH